MSSKKTDSSRRSYARSGGPRPVESRSSTSSVRNSSRTSSSTATAIKTNKRQHHRVDSQHAYDLDRYTQTSQQYPSSKSSSPGFKLLFMGQPPASVGVDSRFQPSVILTARDFSSYRSSTGSNLMAVATVLMATSSGQWISSPSGVLRGKRPVDNLHELPADYRNRLSRDVETVSQGYFAFPDVAICKPGIYRVRISLISFPDARSGKQDTETLVYVDSEAFRVVHNHDMDYE